MNGTVIIYIIKKITKSMIKYNEFNEECLIFSSLDRLGLILPKQKST